MAAVGFGSARSLDLPAGLVGGTPFLGAPRGPLGVRAIRLFPGVDLYSDELRNYALAHCLLLAALIACLHVTDSLRPHRWRATLFFAGAVTAGLYVHSLVSLYLVGFGLIFLLEWALARTDKSKLFLFGAVGLALSALAFFPWLPPCWSSGAS